MPRVPPALALLALLGFSSVAGADGIQTHGPEEFPGKNELSAHLGLQQGLTGFVGGGTPSGFKFLADYAYHWKDLIWLNAGLNFVVGGGGCDAFGNCGYGAGGYAVEPRVGVKLKWAMPIPLVAYGKFNAVFVGVFNRPCGDNGFAVAGAAGGGATYFLTKTIGVGLETNFTLGPGHFGTGGCGGNPIDSHTEFYLSFDISAGAEFIL